MHQINKLDSHETTPQRVRLGLDRLVSKNNFKFTKCSGTLSLETECRQSISNLEQRVMKEYAPRVLRERKLQRRRPRELSKCLFEDGLELLHVRGAENQRWTKADRLGAVCANQHTIVAQGNAQLVAQLCRPAIESNDGADTAQV